MYSKLLDTIYWYGHWKLENLLTVIKRDRDEMVIELIYAWAKPIKKKSPDGCISGTEQQNKNLIEQSSPT